MSHQDFFQWWHFILAFHGMVHPCSSADMVMEASKEPTNLQDMQEQVPIDNLCQSCVMPILIQFWCSAASSLLESWILMPINTLQTSLNLSVPVFHIQSIYFLDKSMHFTKTYYYILSKVTDGVRLLMVRTYTHVTEIWKLKFYKVLWEKCTITICIFNL